MHLTEFRCILLLLISGDISLNPGPTTVNVTGNRQSRCPKNPCTVCCRNIIKSSKAIDCDICHKWTHIRCTESITTDSYTLASEGSLVLYFVCNHCIMANLPFVGSDDIGDPEEDTPLLNEIPQTPRTLTNPYLMYQIPRTRTVPIVLHSRTIICLIPMSVFLKKACISFI